MKKIVLLSLILMLVNVGTASAGKNVFGVSYNVSLPVGDSSDFTSGLQFRGASLTWQSFYNRDNSFGIDTSWNVFTESNEGTTTGDGYSVTGKVWRYQNVVPIYATWHKYWGNSRRGKRTFFALQAGTVYIERRVDVSALQIADDNWHLAVAPEIGIQLPWDAFLGWVSVRYNYAFSAGNIDAQQWFEFRFGFGM